MSLELDDVIALGNYNLTKGYLDSDKTIDILREEGTLIKLAIRSENIEIVRLVLEYFEENQLSKYKESSLEHAALIHKMRIAVENSIAYIDTDEMRELLKAYINPNSNECTSSNDLYPTSPRDQESVHQESTHSEYQDLDDTSYDDKEDDEKYQELSSIGYGATDVGHGTMSRVPTTVVSVEHTEDFLHLSSNRDKAIKLREVGDYCKKIRELKKAEECYRESLDYDSQYYCSYRKLGKLCHEDGRDIEAIEYYVKAIVYKRSDAQYKDVYNSLREIVQRHQSEIELMSKVDELLQIMYQHQEFFKIFGAVKPMPYTDTVTTDHKEIPSTDITQEDQMLLGGEHYSSALGCTE